jgi:hypothetical protein
MARRTKPAPGRATPKGGATRTTGRVTPKAAPKGQVVRTTGRVTPKGGPPKASGPRPGQTPPAPSGRYTPPIPKEYKESPKWVLVLLLAFLIGGMLVILCNYLGLLPGGAKNVYLLVGLGLITCGFVTATRYR